jgi:hypothetical protein
MFFWKTLFKRWVSLKNKEQIMVHVHSTVSTESMIINMKRSTVTEGTEKLMPVWLENWQHCHMLKSLMLFQRWPQLFLKIEGPNKVECCPCITYCKSQLVNRFNAHMNLHNGMSGYTVSADMVAT